MGGPQPAGSPTKRIVTYELNSLAHEMAPECTRSIVPHHPRDLWATDRDPAPRFGSNAEETGGRPGRWGVGHWVGCLICSFPLPLKNRWPIPRVEDPSKFDDLFVRFRRNGSFRCVGLIPALVPPTFKYPPPYMPPPQV